MHEESLGSTQWMAFMNSILEKKFGFKVINEFLDIFIENNYINA